MTWQVATSFTPYVATASSWQSGYEADWLPLIDDHPLIRTYRSTGTSQQVITCRFAGLVSLGGILIQNINAASIQLARSTDGVNYVDLNTDNVSLSTLAVGQHWQYRRYCQALAVSATHVQLTIPNQATLDGALWFEVGSLLFPQFATWPRSPRPGLRERIAREYERAGNSIAKVSPLRVEQEFNVIVAAGQETALKSFALLGEDEPFAVYENNANTAEALLMRKESTIDFERHTSHRVISGLRFRELV